MVLIFLFMFMLVKNLGIGIVPSSCFSREHMLHGCSPGTQHLLVDFFFKAEHVGVGDKRTILLFQFFFCD